MFQRRNPMNSITISKKRPKIEAEPEPEPELEAKPEAEPEIEAEPEPEAETESSNSDLGEEEAEELALEIRSLVNIHLREMLFSYLTDEDGWEINLAHEKVKCCVKSYMQKEFGVVGNKTRYCPTNVVYIVRRTRGSNYGRVQETVSEKYFSNKASALNYALALAKQACNEDRRLVDGTWSQSALTRLYPIEFPRSSDGHYTFGNQCNTGPQTEVYVQKEVVFDYNAVEGLLR